MIKTSYDKQFLRPAMSWPETMNWEKMRRAKARFCFNCPEYNHITDGCRFGYGLDNSPKIEYNQINE